MAQAYQCDRCKSFHTGKSFGTVMLYQREVVTVKDSRPNRECREGQKVATSNETKTHELYLCESCHGIVAACILGEPK